MVWFRWQTVERTLQLLQLHEQTLVFPGVGSSGIFTASNTITVSTATATGGNNGDIWIKI